MKMFRANKFGSTEWSLIELGSLITVLIVIVSMFIFGSRFYNNKAYEERFIARDFSTVIEASQVGVGRLSYVYPINLSSTNLKMNITNNSVMLWFRDGEVPERFWFSLKSGLNLIIMSNAKRTRVEHYSNKIVVFKE